MQFYEMRQAIELGLLPRLPFPGLLVPHTNWQQDQALVTRKADNANALTHAKIEKQVQSDDQ